MLGIYRLRHEGWDSNAVTELSSSNRTKYATYIWLSSGISSMETELHVQYAETEQVSQATLSMEFMD